jgi:DNA-binding transcriptional LysR family regulator
MVRKIEIAAGFTIVDRSSSPLAPRADGREFIREALQVLRIAQAAEAHEPPSSWQPERWAFA